MGNLKRVSASTHPTIYNTLSVIVATLSAVLGASLPVAGHEWEVRRALAPDQTPQWSAAGYLPNWDVTFGDNGSGFRIAGDDDGHYRGTMLVATPVELPNPLPPGFRVRLRLWQRAVRFRRPKRSSTMSSHWWAVHRTNWLPRSSGTKIPSTTSSGPFR